MMKMSVAAVLGTAAMLALPTPVRALDRSQVVESVQRKYSALQTLSASFRQESRVVSLGRSRVKSGTMRFGRPGKMRWDYEEPSPQLLVTDGETLWYYQPELRQVVIQDLGKAFTSQTPLLFLFGEGDLGEEFSWADGDLEAGGDGLYRLELLPRNETPELVGLILDIRSEGFGIAATEITDAFGNRTRLEFSGERENEALEERLFTFEVPPGTEVVRP